MVGLGLGVAAQAKEALVYAQIAYFEAAPAQCAAKLGHSKLRVHHTVTGEMNDGASVFGMTAVDASKQRCTYSYFPPGPFVPLCPVACRALSVLCAVGVGCSGGCVQR
jgi:hypothetical protein